MRVRIFVLGMQRDETTRVFERMLERTFASALAEPTDLIYHENIKDAIADVSRAFTECDAVLFFPDRSVFAQVKTVLCKALRIPLETDEKLMRTASLAAPDAAAEPDFDVRNAGIPEGGEPFALSDALYSGFGVHRGRQTVIVLPAGVERTSVVLAQQAIPYLNRLHEETLPTEYAEFVYAYALQDKLEGSDTVIALSDSNTTALIRRYLSHTPALNACTQTAAKAEKRGNMPPDEYIVNLSITAAEFLKAPYGIAMTNAFYSGESAESERVVYLSVTSETENTVREVTSFYGESTPDLMNRCCGELCALIAQVMDLEAGVLQREPVKKEKKKKKGKAAFVILLLVLLLLLGGVIAYGWYFFTQNGYSLGEWLATYFPESYGWFSSHFPGILQETTAAVAGTAPVA